MGSERWTNLGCERARPCASVSVRTWGCRMLRVVASALCTSWIASPSGAQTYERWFFDYFEATEAGDLSSCNASVGFSNAFFKARLFDDFIDFVYYRDDFTLPYDRDLGSVVFRIDGEAWVLEANTIVRLPDSLNSTSQTVFFRVASGDQGSVFSALRDGSRFVIEFPNGLMYEFPLAGSTQAFEQASNCWGSRPTGSFSNNPFEPNAESNNPFDVQ